MVKLRSFQFICLLVLGTFAICLSYPQSARADGAVSAFQSIPPEELKMTADPDAPGAPAIILYRNVYRDDASGQFGNTAHENDYVRIKILTEEGRKQADVELEYDKDIENIVGLHARTVNPDGTTADFDGKVTTKTVVKGLGWKSMAKTFTLPAVQVGSIIEYYYTVDLSERLLHSSHWILSQDLFTKSADFALKPFSAPNSDYDVRVRWTWQNMPMGSPDIKEGDDGMIRLHATNIDAFPIEDMMPPENELKARVDFNYLLDAPESDPSRYWVKVGKRINGFVDAYLGSPKTLQDAVEEIVSESDPPDVKLQKIYARVQKIRNTTYEVDKTDQELKRSKQKESMNAREVWKRGYGDRDDITLLYLALVRAAGFDAKLIVLSDRANYFFNPDLMQGNRLDAFVVLVNVNGKKLFCDPGAAYTPLGLLPWARTGVQGLQLDKKEPLWVTTLMTTPEQAVIERRATLTLDDAGDLQGKVTVSFKGLIAARNRVEERNADETERKKYLEEVIKGFVPVASEVKLTNQPDWKSSDAPLVAEADLKIPEWATGAGKHMLVPAGLFGGDERKLFDHADRIYPIYAAYPFMKVDDVDIQLPADWKVSGLPTGKDDQKSGRVVSYALSAEASTGKIHLTRAVTVNFIFLDKKYYPALRRYFQEIKSTDDEQIVLDTATQGGNSN